MPEKTRVYGTEAGGGSKAAGVVAFTNERPHFGPMQCRPLAEASQNLPGIDVGPTVPELAGQRPGIEGNHHVAFGRCVQMCCPGILLFLLFTTQYCLLTK